MLHNSIIAGNSNVGGSAPDCSGTITSQGYNLIASISGCVIAGTTTGNLLGQPSGLGPLQNNGGPTLTHALLMGSFAIDAGDPTGCARATDQRGFFRLVDGNGDGVAWCDIGAFEYASFLFVPTSMSYLPLIQK
jgi:hypothetical protein